MRQDNEYLKNEVMRLTQLLSFKNQEIENMQALLQHHDHNLINKESQLEQCIKEISDRDSYLNTLELEINVLKDELKVRQNELQSTNRFLEENLSKIDNHPVIEKQLQIRDNNYNKLKND